MATVFLASSNYRLIKVKIVPFGEKNIERIPGPEFLEIILEVKTE